MKPNDFKPDLDRQYESAKQEWILSHPEATHEDYERAIKAIADRLGY
jgi:hypothetical protein